MIDAGQIIAIISILATALILGRLLSPYLVRVFTSAPQRLDRLLNPVEGWIYRLGGIDPARRMGWREYFISAFSINIIQMAIAFLILLFQGVLPLNPQGFPGLRWDLALNTVVSFATNTNLQHYAGETTLSYFSQMTAIQFLQFTSAATGISVAVAMVRGFVSGRKDIGNFYVDFVRTITRVLIPLCFIASLILVAMGVPQTLDGYMTVKTVEGATRSILVGPVASLVSIMQIGTNGGGYYGANSAYPFQNPTPLSNIFELLLMMLIPTALIFVYGRLINDRKESRPILIGAYGIYALDIAIAFIPAVALSAGMETRIGGFFSTLWTVTTTAMTTGSVNSSLSSMNPLAILAGFVGMLVQASPGGDGVGLMYMLMYIIMTVFLVGLMSGRTPEYLGMKITGGDVKLVMAAFLVHPVIILVPTVLSYATGAATSVITSSGAIGFTQILYEFTSAAANNGSDFLGSLANTPFFNISTAVVMFVGRYAPMAILLALGGSMLSRRRTSETALKTSSVAFSTVLIASIMLLVVLTFFPVLALGPILSFLQGHTAAGVG
ncbi:MAG: potassium-transporting ATPase subunit A [Nitrososphaerota archaeon]|nr:potassium-transporting ATPase subunit A [Nitrososphaerota archaeon]